MITAKNFWEKDLEEIESVFLRDGQKITDLPPAFSESVPVQGSVLLGKTVNVDSMVKPIGAWRLFLLKMLPARFS